MSWYVRICHDMPWYIIWYSSCILPILSLEKISKYVKPPAESVDSAWAVGVQQLQQNPNMPKHLRGGRSAVVNPNLFKNLPKSHGQKSEVFATPSRSKLLKVESSELHQGKTLLPVDQNDQKTFVPFHVQLGGHIDEWGSSAWTRLLRAPWHWSRRTRHRVPQLLSSVGPLLGPKGVEHMGLLRYQCISHHHHIIIITS